MTWMPGFPVVTASDWADWQAWRKASKLEGQRWRRAHYRRIDYYPSEKALAVILERTGYGPDGTFSAVIDALVLAGVRELPELTMAK